MIFVCWTVNISFGAKTERHFPAGSLPTITDKHNDINRMCKIKWMFLFPINIFSIIQPLYSKRGSLKALLTWPILLLSSVLAASFLTRCWLSSSVEIGNCYSSCLLCQHLFASCSIWGEKNPEKWTLCSSDAHLWVCTVCCCWTQGTLASNLFSWWVSAWKLPRRDIISALLLIWCNC